MKHTNWLFLKTNNTSQFLVKFIKEKEEREVRNE